MMAIGEDFSRSARRREEKLEVLFAVVVIFSVRI